MTSLGFGPAAMMGDGNPLTVTYIGRTIDTTDLTTYNTAAQQGIAIGSPALDRLVAVVVGGDSGANRTISSATIGGVAAGIVQSTNSGGVIGIIYAVVPTGTTADIFVTFNNTVNDLNLHVYTITGYLSATPDSTGTSTAAPGSVSVTATAPAVIIAGAHSHANATTCTWANITENADNVIEATNADSAASILITNSYSAVAVTSTWTTATNPCMALAVWR